MDKPQYEANNALSDFVIFAQIRNYVNNLPFLGGTILSLLFNHIESVAIYARNFPLYRKCVIVLSSNIYFSITIHNDFFSNWGYFVIIPNSISQMGIPFFFTSRPKALLDTKLL